MQGIHVLYRPQCTLRSCLGFYPAADAMERMLHVCTVFKILRGLGGQRASRIQCMRLLVA